MRSIQRPRLEGSDGPPSKRTEKIETENKKLQEEKALLAACAGGDLKEVEKLVDSGVDVNSSDQNQMTALHYGSMHTRDDVIKSLISRGAEVNTADLKGGFSALHWVVMNAIPKYSSSDRLEGSLTALAKAGCRVNATDFNFTTPLHMAAQKGNRDGVRVLLRLGADPNRLDITGRNCVDVAKNEPMKIYMKELLHMSSKKDDHLDTRHIYDHLEAQHIYHILEPPLPSSPAPFPTPAKHGYARKSSLEEHIYNSLRPTSAIYNTLEYHSPPSSLRPTPVIYNTLEFRSPPSSSGPTPVIYNTLEFHSPPSSPSLRPTPVIYHTLEFHSPPSSPGPTSVIYNTLELSSPPSSPSSLRPTSVIYNTLEFHSPPSSPGPMSVIYNTLEFHSPPSSPEPSVIYNTLEFHSPPTSSSSFGQTPVTPLEAPHIYDVPLPSIRAPLPPLFPPKLAYAGKSSHEEHIYSTLDLNSPPASPSSLRPTPVSLPPLPPRRRFQYLDGMDLQLNHVLVPARKSRTTRTPNPPKKRKTCKY